MSSRSERRTPPRRGGAGRRGKRRLTSLWVLLGIAAVIAGVVTTVIVTSSSSSSTPQAPPLLAGADSSATGQPVDGIQCETMERTVYHIHAHLAVFVDGSARTVPAGIGVAPPQQIATQSDGTPFVVSGSCFYWLHSHTQDGIIHIESPTPQTYTLGEYFDIWRQPVSLTQVGPARGSVTAYVDGQRWSGDPRGIPLTAHALIQLDVGVGVGPQGFSFPAGL